MTRPAWKINLAVVAVALLLVAGLAVNRRETLRSVLLLARADNERKQRIARYRVMRWMGRDHQVHENF